MSSRISPRTNRKPVKTQVVTESHLNYLQKEVEKYNSQIASIQKKIDLHLSKKSEEEMIKAEDEKKLKHVDFIKTLLDKYRKEIGMPSESYQQSFSNSGANSPTSKKQSSSSRTKKISESGDDSTQILSPPNTLLDYTILKFNKKKAEIDDLSEQIRRLQEMLAGLQSQALKTKNIIDKLNLLIPNLKIEFSKLNFDETVNAILLDRNTFKKVASIDFNRESINQRKSQIKQLKKEIQDLVPPKVMLKMEKHPGNNKNNCITIPPSKEMSNAKSFEDKKIKNGMINLKPILMHASMNRTNNVSIRMRNVSASLGGFDKSIDRIKNKLQGDVVVFKLLKPSGTFNQFKEKAKEIIELKEKIKKNKKELDEIRATDIPKIKALSPEGLLKWYNDLVKQINIESTKYDSDIDRARRQLKDAQKISDKKIAMLTKSVEEKKSGK